MATHRTTWQRLLTVSVALTGMASGLWYSHRQGWLAAAYDAVRQRVSQRGTAPSNGPDMEDMPGMPGMKISKGRESSAKTSELPGYAQLTIAPELQQRIGVKLEKVEEGDLRMHVRAVGIIRPDETKVSRVHLRTDGWVEELLVNFTGEQVKEGDPLLAIYSPDLTSAQNEYLIARKGQPALAESTVQKLELLGVSHEEIQKLKETGEPQTRIILRSSLTGTVLEKNAFVGQRVTPKDELYLVADLSTVWVQAKVYEYELPHVELGQPAAVTVPALPERELTGKVVFIQPVLEEATRTVQVRIELPNPDGLLKPGMFADVDISHDMGKGLLVPAEAVIRTGEHDLVFKVEPAGGSGMSKSDPAKSDQTDNMSQADVFEPVEVTISPVKFGDRFQVLKGLSAGDKVVTSATFLIDSESRLRFSGGGMVGMPGMEMSDKKMNEKNSDHSKMKH